jgi:hypothetical protein
MKRAIPPILLVLAIALLASILVRSMDAAAREPTADDGYYLRFMQRVGAEGLPAFPRLFDEWNATPKDWIFPPPSRVGFIVATALWCRSSSGRRTRPSSTSPSPRTSCSSS